MRGIIKAKGRVGSGRTSFLTLIWWLRNQILPFQIANNFYRVSDIFHFVKYNKACRHYIKHRLPKTIRQIKMVGALLDTLSLVSLFRLFLIIQIASLRKFLTNKSSYEIFRTLMSSLNVLPVFTDFVLSLFSIFSAPWNSNFSSFSLYIYIYILKEQTNPKPLHSVAIGIIEFDAEAARPTHSSVRRARQSTHTRLFGFAYF